MITEFDLDSAIAECMGAREPNANTCIKLAAFITIKQFLFPEKKTEDLERIAYSYADAPSEYKPDSNTEFAELFGKLPIERIFPILDELMSTLQVLQPSLYNGVIRRLKDE